MILKKGADTNPYLKRENVELNLEFSPRGVELVATLRELPESCWKIRLGYFSEKNGRFILTSLSEGDARKLASRGLAIDLWLSRQNTKTLWVDLEEDGKDAENGPVPVGQHEGHP
jgi:hypothetical protein